MTQTVEQMGYALPLQEARAVAQSRGLRERVLVYVTRRHDELLVFEHTDEYPDAGVQVPAGGVDPGEVPDQTARRETLEEVGLNLDAPVHMASWLWTRAGHSQVWHYYWLRAPLDIPDRWAHQVTGGEDDQGMTFLCRFAPLGHPELISGYGYEAALPQLRLLLKENAHDRHD